MRVPILRQGQNTRPSGQKRNFLSGQTDPNAFGAGLGRGLQQVGQAINAAMGQVRARNEKSSRFKTATDFSVFQQEMGEKLGELRRTTDPAKVNYANAAEDLFDANALDFINNKVPTNLRDEYELRVQQYKQGIIANSLKFQYTEQDAYFRQGLSDEWNKALTAVRNDPSALDAEADRMGNLILESDLSDVEKRNLAREMRFGLLGATYKGAVATGEVGPEAIGIGGNDREAYFRFAKQAESGGNPNARTKVKGQTAAGLYGFTAPTWKKLVDKYSSHGLTYDGRMSPEQQEIAMRLFTADNEAVLEANGVPVTNQTRYMAHFLGAGLVDNVVTASDSTPMRDIVPPSYLRANAFLRSMDVGDFKAWAAKKGGGSADPRFADLPFSDKEALYRDALAQERRQQAAQDAANEALYNQQIQNMERGIITGTFGMQQLNEQFNNGNVNPKDYWRMEGRINRGAEDAQNLSNVVEAAKAGSQLDPYDTDNKKGADQLYEMSDGAAQVRSRSQEYADQWFNIATNSHVLSPDYTSALAGGLYSEDPQDIMFAAKNLTALNRERPRSVRASGVSEGDLRKAAMIDAVGRHRGAEAAAEFAAGYSNPEIAQNREVRMKAASGILNRYQNEDGMQKAAEAIGLDANQTNTRTMTALWREFDTMFRLGYEKSLTEEEAIEFAKSELEKNWAQQTTNGMSFVMKYPPDKFWGVDNDDLNEMIYKQTGLTSDDQYQLVADAQTHAEVSAGQLPTYFVVHGEFGTVAADESGRPLRVERRVDEEMVHRTNLNKDVEEQEDALAQIYATTIAPLDREISNIQGNEGLDGPSSDRMQQLIKDREAAMVEYNEQKEVLDTLKPRDDADRVPAAKEAETFVSKTVESDKDVELPATVDKDFKKLLADTPVTDFVPNSILAGEPDGVMVRRLTRTGPMSTLWRADPAYVKDRLKEFQKTAGFGSNFQKLPIHMRIGIYDAMYAERVFYKNVPLGPELQAYVDDPEPNEAAFNKLAAGYPVRANSEQFMRATLQRSVLRALQRQY